MTEYDRVILRRWPKREGGDVIALFPDITGDTIGSPWNVQSYMHLGQHSPADYNHVVRQTTLVRIGDPEGMELLAELRAIGYNPYQMLRRVRR